jgi:hypothetical protein
VRIYVPTVIEGQEWVLPKIPEDNHILFDLRGQHQIHWIPLPMELLTESEDGTRRGYSDFPWYGEHVLILRKAAAKRLRRIMAPYGEFLSLKGGDELELFNATTELDALDEDRSRIVRYDDGSLLEIERYVLRREAIGNALIFKLPYRASSLYVQAPFVEQISAMGLSGIGFKLIWSDEIDPVRQITYPTRNPIFKTKRWWPF